MPCYCVDKKNDQKCLSFAYVEIYQILAMYLATNQRSRLIDVVRNVILLVRNGTKWVCVHIQLVKYHLNTPKYVWAGKLC